MNDKVSVSLVDGMHLHAHTTGFDAPIPLDSDPEAGGQEKGHRPLEMLLVGLGGCMMMDVISILRKKKQEFSDARVSFETEQFDGHPHVYTVINMHFEFVGTKLLDAAVARSLELSYDKYCPANAMLRQSAEINYSYSITLED